jgi:hypothetical protein
VFFRGKWQDRLVPVENGAPKRGGRLSQSTGFSRVIIARLLDVVGVTGARAVMLSSNSEYFESKSRLTGRLESESRRGGQSWLGLMKEWNC